jgi:trk system potassium uptake protein TrkA
LRRRLIVVGLGHFGTTVATRLHELGHEVVALDEREGAVDAIGPKVSRAIVGDGTKKVVLEEAGARDADAAIVAIGDHLAASVLTMLALRDLGLKEIHVKVGSDEHVRIADALGVDDTVFPERETALALASRLGTGGAGAVLKYVTLAPQLSVQEMAVPAPWRGKTLRELALPRTHQIQVVGVHDLLRDVCTAAPDPDRPLTPSDTLFVAGDPAVLQKLAELTE